MRPIVLAWALLVSGGCATAPPPLNVSWHLVREPEPRSAETRASGPPPHRILLAVVNTGSQPLDVPGLVINGSDSRSGRPYTAPAARLEVGEVRVIDLGLFRCWLPVSVTLAAGPSSRGDATATLPLPAAPSALPLVMQRDCVWPAPDPGKRGG